MMASWQNIPSRIQNLVGLCGILSLINADGWNAAVDLHKLQLFFPLPSTRRVWEPHWSTTYALLYWTYKLVDAIRVAVSV